MPHPQVRHIPTSYGAIDVVTSGQTSHHFPRHFHENFPFGVVEAGVLGFNYRGEKLAAWQGTINLANPGEVHDGFPMDGGGWCYRMFYVGNSFLQAVMDTQHETAFPWFRSGVIRDTLLAGNIARLHRQIQANTLTPLAIENELFSLLTNMVQKYSYRRIPEPPAGGCHASLQAACEMMRAGDDQTLTLQSLANVCGFSPGYFIRAFRSQYGMTPHQYQLLCRIQRARQQILQGEPLSQAAIKNGFVDQSHFNHVYKQFYGYTPGKLAI